MAKLQASKEAHLPYKLMECPNTFEHCFCQLTSMGFPIVIPNSNPICPVNMPRLLDSVLNLSIHQWSQYQVHSSS